MAPKLTTNVDKANKVRHATFYGLPGQPGFTISFPLGAFPGYNGYQMRITMPGDLAQLWCAQQTAVNAGVKAGPDKGAWLMVKLAHLGIAPPKHVIIAAAKALTGLCADITAAIKASAEGKPIPQSQAATGQYQAGGLPPQSDAPGLKVDSLGALGDVPMWAWAVGLGAVGWFVLGGKR